MLSCHFSISTAFDISADLTELGKTPVAVVCAGAKSILDIELTLEYLVSPLSRHTHLITIIIIMILLKVLIVCQVAKIIAT